MPDMGKRTDIAVTAYTNKQSKKSKERSTEMKWSIPHGHFPLDYSSINVRIAQDHPSLAWLKTLWEGNVQKLFLKLKKVYQLIVKMCFTTKCPHNVDDLYLLFF